MKSVLIMLVFLVSCVGTIEDAQQIDNSKIKDPKQDFIFNGALSASWVSDTRLSVKFSPAIGGSGNFRYLLLDEAENILGGEFGSNLTKDSNGLLRMSAVGLVQSRPYRFLVRAIDIDRDIPDVNNNYVEVTLPEGTYAKFNGIQRCEPFSGANGATQLKVVWQPGTYLSDLLEVKSNSISSYKVYYCEKSKGTDCLEVDSPDRKVQIVVDPFSDGTTIAGLLPNTSYFFRVTGISQGGTNGNPAKLEDQNIKYDECQTEVSSGPIVFDGITNVELGYGENGINEVSVDWDSATGGYIGYKVYYHPVVDENSTFNYLDPNIQSIDILESDAVSKDLVGLDSFTYHAFLVKACDDFSTCAGGNDANEKFIVKQTKPMLATFTGISSTANDANNPSNVFLNFNSADTSFGGIFDEYRVFITNGVDLYDITNTSITNNLGVLYPSAPADYADLYLENFNKTNIAINTAQLNGLKPGVIYTADVQAWVSRVSPLPIQGGSINAEYGTTSTVPVLVSNDDTTSPLISSMTVNPITGTIRENETITFVINYNESLIVSGVPRIGVNIGGVVRYANLTSSTSTQLTFLYTVQAGDNDLDGIAFDTSTISLNGGNITDLSLNIANLNFVGVQPTVDSIFVDTIPPDAPTGITITNDWLSSVSFDQSASWVNPATDFAFAEIGVGSNGSGTANAVAFTNSNSVSSHAFPDIRSGLVECFQEYQVMVRSVDAAGLQSTVAASAQTFRYDSTPPQTPSTSLVGTTNDIFVANEVSWTPVSDTCALDHYEISIGYDDEGDGFNSDDLNNILDWSSVPGGSGTINYQARSGIDAMTFTLNASDNFYVSIRALDEAGNPSAPGTSAPFQVDITGPSTPTNLTIASNWINGALPQSSPQVSWINPLEPDFDHIEIALGSSIGQEDIEGLLNIGTFTSYTWPSLSTLTECNQNYPKVIAYDNIGNPSIAATDPNIWFTYDNTSPVFSGDVDISAGGETLPGTAPIANWSANTSTDNCNAINRYELAIGFDDDSDGFDLGDVGNLLAFTSVPGGSGVSQYQVVDGVDGFSVAYVGNINYYLTVRSVDEAGNVSSEVTASSPFSFIIPPSQITVVEAAEIGVSQIEIGWVAPNDNGNAITDYIIEYKESSSGTWITFNDGVSNDTRATITGLNSSTDYDFRVTAYNGSFSSPSPSVTETTFPNHPFFTSSPYAALNLGGATDSKFVALENGTEIFINGSSQGIFNKGQTFQISSAQNDIMEATKPTFIAGRRGSGGNTSKGNIVWNVPSWAGREFLFNGSRDPSHIYTVFAFENTSIDIYRDGVLDSSTTMVTDEFRTFSFPNNGSYRVVSTGVITGYVYSEDNTANRVIDPYPVLPLSKDIIGYPSSSGQYNVAINNTSYTGYYSNSNAAITGTFTNANYNSLGGNGGTNSLYQGEILRIIGINSMTARSTADANGNCSAAHIPMTKMRRNYATNVDLEWIAFGSDQPAVITYREPGGSNQTLTLTRTGTDPLAPYKGRLTGLAEGTTFEANERMAAWYEPSTDLGASNDDETVMYGFD